jgi:hypothetical protein
MLRYPGLIVHPDYRNGLAKKNQSQSFWLFFKKYPNAKVFVSQLVSRNEN